MKESWYHGSRRLFTEFTFVDRSLKTDAGDFGLGIYFTNRLSRARNYGHYLYKCRIDMSGVAEIPNPYSFEENSCEMANLFRSLAFDTVGGDYTSGYAIEIWNEKSQDWRDAHPNYLERHTTRYKPGRMKTCSGSYHPDEKLEASRQIRDAFIEGGYTGIVARDFSNLAGEELAIFDLKAILNIENITPQYDL